MVIANLRNMMVMAMKELVRNMMVMANTPRSVSGSPIFPYSPTRSLPSYTQMGRHNDSGHRKGPRMIMDTEERTRGTHARKRSRVNKGLIIAHTMYAHADASTRGQRTRVRPREERADSSDHTHEEHTEAGAQGKRTLTRPRAARGLGLCTRGKRPYEGNGHATSAPSAEEGATSRGRTADTLR